MQEPRLSLARVMTSANEHANVTDQKPCGPSGGPARIDLTPLSPHARRGRSLAERHTDRGTGSGRPPRRAHAWRTRRARKGAAALDDARDRAAGGAGPADPPPASDRPASGDAEPDRGGRGLAEG